MQLECCNLCGDISTSSPVTVPSVWTSQNECTAEQQAVTFHLGCNQIREQRARSRYHPRSNVLLFADTSTYQLPLFPRKLANLFHWRPPVRNAFTPQVNKTYASSQCVTARVIFNKTGIGFCKKLPDPCFQCSVLAISIDDGQRASHNIYNADSTASDDLCSQGALESIPYKIGQQN